LEDEEKNLELLPARVQKLETQVRLLVALVEAAGWATVALVLTLILVLVPRSGGRILPHAFNVSHVALSAVVALVGYRLARRVLGQLFSLPRWFPWAAGVGAVLIFGGGLEIAQLFVPGQPSWRDLAIDMMGGIAGLLLFVPPSGGGSVLRGLWFRLAGLVVALAAIAPSAAAISGIVVRDRRFPEIARFEPRHQSFVYLRGGAKLSTATAPSDWGPGAAAVQLSLPQGGYAGISASPPRGSWKPFQHLVMPVYSLVDRPITFHVRIHDFGYKGNVDDRFNTTVTLSPGANQLRFSVADIQTAPAKRAMALDEVGYVSLSSSERAEPVALLLRPWRLE
jgi:hypothetical protein